MLTISSLPPGLKVGGIGPDDSDGIWTTVKWVNSDNPRYHDVVTFQKKDCDSIASEDCVPPFHCLDSEAYNGMDILIEGYAEKTLADFFNEHSASGFYQRNSFWITLWRFKAIRVYKPSILAEQPPLP
jgi:hypothetical protein